MKKEFGIKPVNIRIMSAKHECLSLADLRQHFNINDVLDGLDLGKDKDSRIERWLKQLAENKTASKIKELRKKYTKAEDVAEGDMCFKICEILAPSNFPEVAKKREVTNWRSFLECYIPTHPASKDALSLSCCDWILKHWKDIESRKIATDAKKNAGLMDNDSYCKVLEEVFDKTPNKLSKKETKDLGQYLYKQEDFEKCDKGYKILKEEGEWGKLKLQDPCATLTLKFWDPKKEVIESERITRRHYKAMLKWESWKLKKLKLNDFPNRTDREIIKLLQEKEDEGYCGPFKTLIICSRMQYNSNRFKGESFSTYHDYLLADWILYQNPSPNVSPFFQFINDVRPMPTEELFLNAFKMRGIEHPPIWRCPFIYLGDDFKKTRTYCIENIFELEKPWR